MPTDTGKIKELLAKSDLRKALKCGEARRLREEAELTTGDVAELLGVTADAVAKWESGQRVPRAEHALALAELFSALRLQHEGLQGCEVAGATCGVQLHAQPTDAPAAAPSC